MSRRRSKKLEISSDNESSDDEPIVQSVKRRQKQSEQVSEPEEEEQSAGEEASEDEVPKARKRKSTAASARQKPGKPRGEAAGADDGPGPSKKSKRAAAPKKSAKKSARVAAETAAEDGESDEEDDNGRLEELGAFYEVEAAEANPQEIGIVNHAEEMRLVRSVMRYMLFNQQQKNAVPVRRQELTSIILKNHKGGKAAKHLGARIIKRAQVHFVNIFGMEMKEVETKKTTIHGEQEGHGAKVYVLRSLLSSKLRNFTKSVPAQLNQSLAMVIMSIITLAGGKMSEDDLDFQVAKIGVDLKSRHPTLGKPADQLQTMIQKRYLAERKANGPDGVCKEYTVGDVFVDEVPVEKLGAFIEKIFSHAPMTQPA